MNATIPRVTRAQLDLRRHRLRKLGYLARRAGCHPCTLTRWINAGKLQAVRFGREYRSTLAWLRECLAAVEVVRQEKTPPPPLEKVRVAVESRRSRERARRVMDEEGL